MLKYCIRLFSYTSSSRSGYNLFIQDMFKTHKNKSAKEIFILSGELWKDLPKNVKKDYKNRLKIERKIKKLENCMPY